MAQGFIQVPPDSTGKKVDTFITAGAAQHRHAMLIADPSTDAALTKVTNADPGSTDYGPVVRDVNAPAIAAVSGTTTDVAVTGDNNGTLSAKLRGISKMISDMWDSGNHWLKVSIQNATLAVTQSGTWNINNVSGTVSLPTGASTSAKQPAYSSAGIASLDVLTVQGHASMVKLLVTPDANSSVNVAQLAGTATSVNSGVKDAGTLRVVLATDQPTMSNAQPVSQSGTWTVQPGNTANTTAWKVDGSAVTQPVSLASVPSHAVTNAGTFAVQAVDAGDVAHDGIDSGNPVKVGGVARRARATAVSADGDRTNITTDRYGRQQIAGVDLTVLALQVTASGDTSLIAAPGASTRIKLMRLEASNSHATTAVTIGVKTPSLNSGSVFGKKYLPAAGGLAVWVFPGGHLMCGSNEALSINLSTLAQTEVTAYYETVAD